MSSSSCRSRRVPTPPGLRRAPPPCPAECGRAEQPRAECPERPRGWMARALLLGVLMLSLTSPAQSFSPVTDLNTQQETGVCQSLDIRNGPEMFSLLSGCRVVEGFLQILLFDRFNETAYTNLSFPELREITGYLMMYRVNGLKTLSTLFPNLAVIRGHKLFNNYAFILYEMMDMDEIGLFSLTDITRGSVRIEKNFKMCYVSTIDWDVIAASGKEGHYIKDNKPGNECSVCPIELSCPLANKRHLCWNKFHCQKVCAPQCGPNTCSASGECCDNSCLGGCSGSSLLNCTVCRDLSIGDLRDRKCIKDCPNNTFKHQERRCISEAECRKLPPPREFGADKQERPYKPINGTCMLQCPPNFDEEQGKDGVYRCVECKGACRKECPSMNVDSIQAIEKLKGCTHIIGSLEISIRGGGSIVRELEEGLGLIQEITGSLKVARSYPLVSLNFLKSLRVIRGEQKYGSERTEFYQNALTVTDNQNLQELWDWTTHGPIDIMHGKLFFHFNPKLCIEKIEPLQKMARETQFNELEVARNSNGDKVACNVTLLNVTVEKRMQVSMLLSWEAFVHDDSRSLLGYVVHSIESEHRNISLYEGRDACGGDGWHLDDIQASQKEDKVFHLLTHLKPYTQYAIYVKTYTIATERVGAQSEMMYVRTLPGQPSSPRITQAISLSPGSLILKWDPPASPHGNVTQYQVSIKWEEDKEDFFMQRNYCSEPLVANVNKPFEAQEETPKEKEEKAKKEENCQCDSKVWNDEEVIGKITFEDNLQNQVYAKRVVLDDNRRRRDVEATKERYGSHPFPEGNLNAQIQSPQDMKTSKVNGTYNMYFKTVEKTALNISDLRHYASHSISVCACREMEKEELDLNDPNIDTSNCSIKSIVTARTMKLEGADNITDINVKVQQANQSLGVVRLDWQEPPKPNGLVVTFHIQYKRIDIENHSPTTECITRQQFMLGGGSYTIKGLNAGNYSVRVMATSLAGNGNYTALKYFFIEDSGGGGTTQEIVGGVIGALIVMAGLIIVALYVQRKCMPPPPPPPTKLIASVNPEYVSSVYVPDEWEVTRDSINLIKELGQGSFGMVYEGIAQGLGKHDTEIRCAVKTVNEHATDRERIDFLNEASVMKAFDTAHVVRLLGVVSRGQPTLVVMELMANGDLKSYLRSHRPDTEKPRQAQPPSLSRILQMAMEIADGMAYLSAKKFVHRDLAARNCMVSHDLTVKVGDFGMTRDIYETDYYRKGSKGLLPVRWMSPESLKDGVFTSSSDVWSYGVVLWEMATLASQPYQGLSNDQVLRYVIDGGVMERPENCPDRLYQLMQLTWQHRPLARPSFLQLVALLVTDANAVFRTNSFFFSTQGQELLHAAQPQSAGVVEEPASQSASGNRMGSWAHGHLSLGDLDSSPAVSPTTSTRHSPYRDMISMVPFKDRARADPCETEALVGLSQSVPPPQAPKVSPPQSAPNGYLPRASNNGNPSSLSTSRC